MRCTGLQGLSVLHHGFDGIGIKGTGKALVSTLHATDYRNSHVLFCKVAIDTEHLAGFGLGLFAGCMGCMTLLPQELSCTEEQTGTHFPANDVCPLVAQNRQVAI